MDPFVYSLAGLLLGWVVRDALGKRLDPDVVKQVKLAAAARLDEIREDLGGQLAAERTAREEDRVAFAALLTDAMNRTATGQKRTGPDQTGQPWDNTPAYSDVSKEDIERQYRMATTGNKGDPSKGEVKQSLLDKGLTEEEAEAILSGDYEDLPTGGKLDAMVGEAIRQRTGVV